jgi:acetylornithine/succinyldiaminopimelate/putrescine aminotransferase/predicted amino acid dehydrogenase
LTAEQVLGLLHERGVRLSLHQGEIRYEAAKGKLTADLITLMREHRAAIAEQLARGSTAVAAPARPSKRFGFVGQRPRHAPLLDPDWVADHPFYRHVEPYKGQLLRRLRLDKRYVSASGVWMTDEQGNQVFDALSQYGALPFGHHPAEIWAAIDGVRRSAEPAFTANAASAAAGQLAERLIALWPEADFESVTFCNSGAEAVEIAIKLCRGATGRHAMLATVGGFHGLTVGALPLTGNALFREGFAGTDGTVHVPFGDIGALEQAVLAQRGGFAGLVIEPIQGESGIIDPPPGYLAAARRLCDASGMLLVIDEVQTGLGRTGTMFACQNDGVVPDILPLAKALGGGLVPIGACLYRASARSERFGLRHGSTFGGGAIACRAAIATLDRLQADGGALLQHVQQQGEALRSRLLALQARHPALVAGVSGRGFMQGLRLNFESMWRAPGLLGPMHDQNILIHLLTSHLLNAGRARLAPSFSAGNVLRLQPALIADGSHLDHLTEALAGTLDALQRGDSFALAEHLLAEEGASTVVDFGRSASADTLPAEPRRPTPQARPATPNEGRFAFTVHPLSLHDIERFDPSLARVTPEAAQRLLAQFADFVDPQPIEAVEIVGIGGARAYGELILIPYTPHDLMRMAPAKAMEEVELAVRVAQERGAQVVGLGGFTSIVTQGGLGLMGKGLPALTSGNSFTATATVQALLAACRRRGVDPGQATVAVVGAGGMVGRALSFLLAQHFARLVLVGNINRPAGYRARAVALGQDLVEQLRRHADMKLARPGSLAEHLSGAATLADLEREGRLQIGQDLAEALPQAQTLALATNSIETFVKSHHLGPGAIVCDTSRPFNVDPEVAATRPDVELIEGGLVQLPAASQASLYAGPRPGLVYACAAETMLWALERAYERVTPDGCMEVASLLDLAAIAERQGFAVASHP